MLSVVKEAYPEKEAGGLSHKHLPE